MDSCKLTFILLTILIYLLYQSCNKDDLSVENFTNVMECKDDSTWFVEDADGRRHYCNDIGTNASCYDRDSIGREGWETCIKQCGNCANTKVTTLPQNVLATFSGDPIEDFGVVLQIDKDRQFVGKQDGADDIRGYVDQDKDEDIEDIIDRLESTEDIFDLITGNVVSCKNLENTQVSQGQFRGCNNILPCPSTSVPTPTEIRNYIFKDKDSNIQFPAKQYSCSNIPNSIVGKPDECKKYYLFDKIIDRDDDSSTPVPTKNKTTLYDMCPLKCGSSCIGHSKPIADNKDDNKDDLLDTLYKWVKNM